jgi:hypothetical protein
MSVPVLFPDYAQAWMTDPRSWMVLLIVGIVAAIFMWYRNYWVNAIGIVLNIVLIAAWGWLVCSMGYWEGSWFLARSPEQPLWNWILRIALLILYPGISLIFLPGPHGKNAHSDRSRMRWGQFNMLVIVICLSYLASVLMMHFWERNVWSVVAFAALPVLYMLVLLGKARVNFSSLFTCIPASIVASLTLVGAMKQSIAVSAIFAYIVYGIILVAVIVAFAKIGSALGLDTETKTIGPSSSGGTNTSFDARAYGKQLEFIRKHGW